jgi:hypothetical protein
VRKKFLQYFTIIVLGVSLLLACSFFQNVASVEGEYHYSTFLRNNYLTIPGVTIFVLTGLAVGYFWGLNPWVAGICLFLSFPVTAIYEATVYKGSHNLIPFEFIFFMIYAMPSILAMYFGKYFATKIPKRNK